MSSAAYKRAEGTAGPIDIHRQERYFFAFEAAPIVLVFLLKVDLRGFRPSPGRNHELAQPQGGGAEPRRRHLIDRQDHNNQTVRWF